MSGTLKYEDVSFLKITCTKSLLQGPFEDVLTIKVQMYGDKIDKMSALI